MTNNPWRVGNDGSGVRIHFVCRPKDPTHPSGAHEFHKSKTGLIIRYATRQAAERVAKRLNENA